MLFLWLSSDKLGFRLKLVVVVVGDGGGGPGGGGDGEGEFLIFFFVVIVFSFCPGNLFVNVSCLTDASESKLQLPFNYSSIVEICIDKSLSGGGLWSGGGAFGVVSYPPQPRSIGMQNPTEGPFWGPEMTVQQHVEPKKKGLAGGGRLLPSSSGGNRWGRMTFDPGG